MVLKLSQYYPPGPQVRPLEPGEEVETGDWVRCTNESPSKWREFADTDEYIDAHGVPQECCIVRRPVK